MHSVFSQPTRHSAKQYVRQPSLHLYIQFYVSFMSVNHHHIYTFSFQSTNQPFNKAICQPIIIACLQSTNNQPTNHSTECVSYPSSKYALRYSQPYNHSKKLFVGQTSIHLYIHLYVSQPSLHIHIQLSGNQQIIQQSNMSGNHH